MRIMQLQGNEKDYKIIYNELKRIGVSQITWKKSIEEGMEYLDSDKEQVDVILSDICLPIQTEGKPDWRGGNLLIRELQRRGLQIPVVIVSSAWMPIDGAYACIWFMNNRDWEQELAQCIKQIAKETYQYL